MNKILDLKNLSYVQFVVQIVDEIYLIERLGKKRLITKERIYE